MARTRSDLPRMQKQAPIRAPRPPAVAAATQAVEKPAQTRKPPMMRQYDLIERVRRYNPDTNEALLNRAYVYAMKAHGEQRRASGDPYFSHPIEVAAILTDLKLDDATIAAALLHDTIEDTAATRAEIDSLFGRDIGTLVEGLTKLKKLDLVTKEAKQAENLRKLLLAIADDVRVLLIKLADRLHNMRTLGYMPPEARRRAAEETLEIYAPLAGRMGMHEMREELDDLAFRELYPEAYEVVSARLNALTERSKLLISEIEKQLTKKLADRGIDAKVVGRRKARLLDLAQDGAQVGRLRTTFGHLWVPRRRENIGRLLPGARYRAQHLADGAGPLQGLHLDAEGQRLPVDPHDRDRPEQAARRAADPHRGDARDRRIRHRRACALQGPCGFADGIAVAGIDGLCLASPDHRTSGGRFEPGRISRAHQARTVSRPGLLFFTEGQADRAAAQGNADRFCLCGAYGCRKHRGRLQDQRPDRAIDLRTREWRRGRNPDLEGAKGTAGCMGIHCGHRQGTRGDPAGDARRGAHAICRARPPDCRAPVPARQDRLFGREISRARCRGWRARRSKT